MRGWFVLFGIVCLGALGCETYRDQLSRSQGYYEQNQYELSLAVLRNVENDQDSLSSAERVRYCYLRGMTDYRLDYRTDARYWLGMSRAAEARAQGALNADELTRLDQALADLNATLFGTTQSSDPKATDAVAKTCQWSSECNQSQVCEAGHCVSIR